MTSECMCMDGCVSNFKYVVNYFLLQSFFARNKYTYDVINVRVRDVLYFIILFVLYR